MYEQPGGVGGWGVPGSALLQHQLHSDTQSGRVPLATLPLPPLPSRPAGSGSWATLVIITPLLEVLAPAVSGRRHPNLALSAWVPPPCRKADFTGWVPGGGYCVHLYLEGATYPLLLSVSKPQCSKHEVRSGRVRCPVQPGCFPAVQPQQVPQSQNLRALSFPGVQ